MATPMITPDGTASRITRLTNPGRARSLFGASDRMKAGMPIVNQAAIVTWRGRNGYGMGSKSAISEITPADADEQRQEHGVHRLGEEQVGDALDVADHPPALADHVGQRGEAVVEQHDLGHGPRRRTARAHRHADVGVLEGEHVVDAVAGHRHGVASRLQRADHRPLLIGAHPTERGRLLERLGEGVPIVGERAGVDGGVAAGQSQRRRRRRRPRRRCRRR